MTAPRLQLSPHALAEAKTCVHCGLCLPACPTYVQLGQEMDSPRGRIYLMRALHDGRVEWGPSAALHLDRCLDCRACETACPIGVGYGSIVEEARGRLEPWRNRGAFARALLSFLLGSVIPRPRRVAALGRLVRWSQATGLAKLARFVPGRLAAFAPALPRVRPVSARRNWRAGESGPERPIALLHPGCVMDALFGGTNLASARLLELAGYEVHIDLGSGCCGSLHAHVGFADRARDLARATIASFEASGAEIAVSNAAGCGAHMKAYSRLLAGDPAWEPRARAYESRVRDLTQALGEGGLPAPARPFPKRVVYQDACHLGHGQGVRREPRDLLRRIEGLELVEIREADACCGSAGVYNLLQPELSTAILDRKVEAIRAARPDAVVTANPGCLLQLSLGMRRAGLDIQVMHLADLLDLVHAPS
mgnify:CR=1 FL=1